MTMAIETKSTRVSNTGELAKVVVMDIKSKKLRQGDRYLTGDGVSSLLGVSLAKAHRVLNVLVEKQWIERSRPHGTFVGPKAAIEEPSSINNSINNSVWVLFREGMQNISCYSGFLVESVAKKFPNTSLNFHIVPNGEAYSFTKNVIDKARNSDGSVSFVACGCSREVYDLLGKSGLPSVVIGSLHSGQSCLPSLDTDNFEAGRAVVRYLSERGHKRLAVFISRGWYAGDDILYNGIVEEMTNLKMPPNALSLLPLSEVVSSFSAEVESLLSIEKRPTAVILTNHDTAKRLEVELTKRGIRVPEDIEIAVFRLGTDVDSPSPYTYVRAKWSNREKVEFICKILGEMRSGEKTYNQRTVVPVEIVKAY
jgi:DNA-binding LacI/PurR family transcriptional regulator/DNA-binding transcriptional regulator YhcF (GntR family)